MAGGHSGEREGVILATPESRPPAPTHYAPLGLPLEVWADDRALLEALEWALAGWQDAVETPHPSLRLTLHTAPAVEAAGPYRIEVEGPVLRIKAAGFLGAADARTGTAHALLSPDWRDDRATLRDLVIEPLLLFLLTRSGRTPIHAAGLVAGDVGLLLSGPAGSGKSCLALAGYAAGLGLLSDDLVYVQTDPSLRAWGLPRPVHLFAQDAGGRSGPIRLRQGKSKQAITLDSTTDAARRLVLVVLQPGDAVSLDRITPGAALRAMGPLEPGFDLLADDIARTVARIAAPGAWRLRLSRNPHEAIALLSRALPALCAGAAA